MKSSLNDRDIKVSLGSIRQISKIHEYSPQNTQFTNEDGDYMQSDLQTILKGLRKERIKQIFMQKMSRRDTFKPPAEYIILSEKQLDSKRLFRFEGFQVDERVLSLIYILDIIFVLITFVIGTFIGFLDQFRQQEGQSKLVMALFITSVVITSVKIFTNTMAITIEDGIKLIYLTDIIKHYVLTLIVFIDFTYVGIMVTSIVQNNKKSQLGVTMFIFSLIKLFSLFGNLRVVETNFMNSSKKQRYWNLIKVAIFNVFFAHFIASIFLAMSQIDEVQNWKVYKGIDVQHWFIQYLWSFYWATTTMMTVGFGDFLPVTYRQSIIVAFVQLFSCIVLAYNISQIGSIISAIRSSNQEYKKKIGIFKRMARQDQIQEGLQRRIEAYIRQQSQIKQKFQFKQQAELLNQLPQNLRQQYIIQSNKHIFPDLPFFKNLQKTTLIKLSQSFSGQVYYPGQYLTRFSQANTSIMILKSGTVGLAYKKMGSVLTGTIVQNIQIKQRQVLNDKGQYEKKIVPFLLNTDFLSRTKNINYDIVALNYSFVFHINYESFFQILKTCEIDNSYFFSIYHKHSILSSQWQQLVCEFCQKDEQIDKHQRINKDYLKYHTKFDCPRLHFFPLTGIVILKSIRSGGNDQHRDQSHVRIKLKSDACLSLRKKFFKKYQRKRNLTFAQKKHKKTRFNIISRPSLQSIEVSQTSQSHIYLSTAQKKQQEQLQMQNIIKNVVQQCLTGYKSGFWDLEIDVMYDYNNYFPLENVHNLDFVRLGQLKLRNENKNHQSEISSPIKDINGRRRVRNTSTLQKFKSAEMQALNQSHRPLSHNLHDQGF